MAGVRRVSALQLEPSTDQLGTRCLILDQDRMRPVLVRQRLHLALEIRIVETLAEHIDQVELVADPFPGRAHAVVAELGGLVCGVPTLQDPPEPLGAPTWFVISQPCGFDHGAAERGWVLLILGGEGVLGVALADPRESRCRLALGVQDSPNWAREGAPAQWALDQVGLSRRGDRG